MADVSLAQANEQTGTKHSREEFEGAYESKNPQDSSLVASNYETRINGLETQLREKDAHLKESQAALLRHGRRAGVTGLDDRQISQRFASLAKSINDCVVTHFKTIRPGVLPSRDVEAAVQAAFPNYAVLLQTSRTKYLVLRGPGRRSHISSLRHWRAPWKSCFL